MYEAFITSLIRVGLLVAMCIPGFIVKKTKMIGESAVSTLVVVLLYIASPFLSISSLLECEFNMDLLVNMLIVLVGGFVFHIALYFAFKPVFARMQGDNEKRILLAASLFGNTGYMGIPVIKALYPGNAEMLVYTVVFNVSSNILFWTLTAYIISGEKKSISLKSAFINPPTLGFLVALPFFIFNVNLPTEITDICASFGDMVAPLSMLILGIRLADVNFKHLFTNAKLYLSAALKLIVMPVIVFFVLFLINLAVTIDYYVIATQLIIYAMPTANVVLSLAELYKKDGISAAQTAMLSTLLSVLSIPTVMLLMELL